MIVGQREQWAAWGARLSFAGVLLVLGEFGVWESPGTYGATRWLAVAAIYLAMAAASLDLIARFHVREILSLLLVAGMVGLTNSLLISHSATRDLPLSLIARPLGAHPLIFLLALAVFRLMASGRASGPLDMLIALGLGLAWGVWMRWLPQATDDPIPVVAKEDAITALAIGLVGCALIVFIVAVALNRAGIAHISWRLSTWEWGAVGGVLLIALGAGIADEQITAPGWGIVVVLLVYSVMLLAVTQHLRGADSLLDEVTPPRVPNLPAWLVLVIPALIAGWIGWHLPGSGESSLQSDILFGALMGFGLVWLPGVSAVLGMRAFVRLSRQGF